MRKSLFIGILCAAATVVSTPLASLAIHDASASPQTSNSESQRSQNTLDKLNEIQARREAIQDKLAKKRAAITEKLTGERADACEKKQDKINLVLDQRVDAAQKHLDTFNAIRNKLAAFVATKNLNVEGAAALQVIMDDKQTAAQAAIDVARATDFTCEETDASAPGKIVTDQVTTQKEALKEYRTAIKDYASAIKTAATTPATEETEATQ